MTLILLTAQDLAVAALLILLLAGLSFKFQIAVERPLLVAAVRTVVQLLLVGMVLKSIFAMAHWYWILLIVMVMLLVAGYEIMGRQQRRFTGLWGFGLGAFSMFVSSFSVTLLVLFAVIGPDPWYEPQYMIPLFGMMFGNTMNGIALGLDRLTAQAWQQRQVIESRLVLGETWQQAIKDIRSDSIRTGMMPIINGMATAGLVSLPGMMTGQILGGVPPFEAVKYQILIMFMVTAGTGFGTFAAIIIGSRHLFDERERLRLDRLSGS